LKWFSRKIEASALQFAILVSVIASIILSSFLLLTYTFNSFTVQTDQVLLNIEHSNAGIEYLFNSGEEILDSTQILIGQTPVTLTKTYLGSFEKVSSSAGEGSKAFKKIALLGNNEKRNLTGIYLEDNNLPLVLAGNTRIEGNAYTPKDIIKAGNISGNYFKGSSLVHGERYSSDISLPKLDLNWKNYLTGMVDFVPGPEDMVIGLEDLRNSFFNERLVVYETSKIIMDQQLLGNILVKSETEIEVTQFSNLDQVLLLAPKVIINSNFHGNIHIIAEEVVLKEKVTLNYPSSIIVVQKPLAQNEKEYANDPKLTIGKNSTFQGNIIYLDSQDAKKSKNDLLIDENAEVEGNVYCEGYTELRGTVLGSIFTKYFVANQSGSIYINHIYNGKVLTEMSKPEMCGILLEGKSKNVAAWLY